MDYLKITDIYGKPVRIYAEVLEDSAFKQFEDGMNAHFAVKGALMPDAHKGYSLPIGAVVATEGYVVPAWVGFDIGCGMCALKTSFSIKHIKQFRDKIFKTIYEKVPTGFSHNGRPTEWDYSHLSMSEKLEKIFNKDGLYQLGSLGSGNHFISLELDEDNCIWIIIHSGSRGVGHALATHYMKLASGDGKAREGLFGLKVDSEHGKEYINDLAFALEFALENRLEMMRRVVKVLRKLSTGREDWTSLINRNHNHAEEKDGLWIHRKGATHAEEGMLGVIPGNMRDGSFIVRGKGNPDSLYSSSHGAGRIMGRKEAMKSLTVHDFKKDMTGKIARIDETTLDESPRVYKNIFDVMECQKDLVEVLHHTVPILTVKG